MRRREILEEALGHIEHQLELVRGRRDELDELERELLAKRRRRAWAAAGERALLEPATAA